MRSDTDPDHPQHFLLNRPEPGQSSTTGALALAARVAELKARPSSSSTGPHTTTARPNKQSKKDWLADVNRASRALRTSGRLPGKGKGKAGQVASKRKAIEQEWLREQPGSIPAAELEDRRAQLTKKAKLYRTLKKGKKAGLTGQQLDNILFDFERPSSESEGSDAGSQSGSNGGSDGSDSGSDSDSEPELAPRVPEEVEEDIDGQVLVDEFGRDMTHLRRSRSRSLSPGAARDSYYRDRERELDFPSSGYRYGEEQTQYQPSEVGTSFTQSAAEFVMPKKHGVRLETRANVRYGDAVSFPVFNNVDEMERRRAALDSSQEPLDKHFRSSTDARALGTGFFQFSADEQTRRRQQEELKQRTESTENVRREVQAEQMTETVMERKMREKKEKLDEILRKKERLLASKAVP